MSEPNPSPISLRPAGPADCRTFWELRNERSAREASISTEPIPFEKHEAWYARKLETPACQLLIVLDCAGATAGYVRFELAGDEAEISICIDAAARGKGYATRAIALASRQFLLSGRVSRIRAHIRETNEGSIRAFDRAGYRLASREETPEGPARWMVLEDAWVRPAEQPAGALAIVQARMGSTRLPGKSLRQVAGKSLLAHCLAGLGRARHVATIVVAAPDLPEDDAIEAEAKALGAHVHRGSLEDVLDRFYQASRRFPGEPIVRLTADCPLMDGAVIDRTIEAFLAGGVEYASTTQSRTFPRGLDVEVFSRAALERAHREGQEPHHREHVTPYLYEHPGRFRVLPVANSRDLSSWRLTVDTPQDFDVIRAVLEGLGELGLRVCFANVVAFLERRPGLLELNRGVRQKDFREVG